MQVGVSASNDNRWTAVAVSSRVQTRTYTNPFLVYKLLSIVRTRKVVSRVTVQGEEGEGSAWTHSAHCCIPRQLPMTHKNHVKSLTWLFQKKKILDNTRGTEKVLWRGRINKWRLKCATCFSCLSIDNIHHSRIIFFFLYLRTLLWHLSYCHVRTYV